MSSTSSPLPTRPLASPADTRSETPNTSRTMTPARCWGDHARRACQRRLAEITADIDHARANGDLGRVPQAENERDFLIRELSNAFGIGGRNRKALATSERARVADTRAPHDDSSHPRPPPIPREASRPRSAHRHLLQLPTRSLEFDRLATLNQSPAHDDRCAAPIGLSPTIRWLRAVARRRTSCGCRRDHHAASRSSSRRLAAGPPRYWPMEPSLRTTRWQGTTTGMGLWAQAEPAARTARGLPDAAASWE